MTKLGKSILLAVAIFSFLIIYFPIIIIALLSFNDSSFTYAFSEFGFGNYVDMFQNENMIEAILRTLLIAFLSTLLSTILGTIFAIGINGLQKKNRIRFMMLNNIPVINADIVTGISLLVVFNFLGMQFGFNTVLLAHVFFSIPLVILTVLPRLKELDPNLLEAAMDLGCNYFEGIYKVILPSIKSSIVAGGLIAFTMSIDDFVISYFVTGRGFDNFSIWLYSVIQKSVFPKEAYAYNTLLMVIAIIVIGYMNLGKNKKGELK
jgi:spermidine/putrescine transport system permease protein